MANPNKQTREKVLNIAEEMFARKGYIAVRLRDIAVAAGIRQPSLYYYAPQGKEQLFIEVMERNLERHRAGLDESIRNSEPDLRTQMYAVADWFLSQPPLDFLRMRFADLKEIQPEHAVRLYVLAYNAMREPVRVIIDQALAQGVIDLTDPDLAAMAFVALMQGIHAIPLEYTRRTAQSIARETIDMLLKGWHKR
jgi:AcrR family transcriptional regulator